jgi:hypothetical protein
MAITIARAVSEDWEQRHVPIACSSLHPGVALDVHARRDGATPASHLTCQRRRNIFVAGTACESWLPGKHYHNQGLWPSARTVVIFGSPAPAFVYAAIWSLAVAQADQALEGRACHEVPRHDETAFTTFCARRHLRSVKSTGTVMDP